MRMNSLEFPITRVLPGTPHLLGLRTCVAKMFLPPNNQIEPHVRFLSDGYTEMGPSPSSPRCFQVECLTRSTRP